MLEVRSVDFGFSKARPVLEAISLTLEEGEVVGLSGRSGAGKSTLGRIVAGHLKPHRGQVLIDGQAPTSGYRAVQYIHQSSIFAVNPRWRLGRIISEAWQPDDVTLDAVGVSRNWYDRYPHEISGGELQRVVLVRALGPQTRFLVADELSAMLDPITQVEIWSFLMNRSRKGLGILAISHDAPLLRRVSSRQIQLAAGGLCVLEAETAPDTSDDRASSMSG